MPLKIKKQHNGGTNTSLMDRFLSRISNFSTGHPILILVVSFVIIILSIGAAAKIRFSHDILRWFPQKNEIRIATEKLDQKDIEKG